MSLNWTIKEYESVESTQDILKEYASNGASEGLVIVGEEQKSGRGRHGNVWDAPKGNLYMSLLLKPNCPAAVAGQYSFIIAVALSDAISSFIDDVHIKKLKWPNDVLIKDKKCAGILLESELSVDGIVSDLYVGVGVNILSPPEDKIGISDVSKGDVTVQSFLKEFLGKIEYYIKIYNKNGFSDISELWMSQAYKLEEEIKVRLPNKVIYGVFEGIDSDGTLLLRLDNGEVQAITAGEVYF